MNVDSSRSIVVDHLRTTVKDEKVATLCMFCNYKERNEQTVINLIASLLKQLVQQRGTVSENVRTLYDKHVDRNARPTQSEFEKALQSEIAYYSKVFIVVDALDECPEVTVDGDEPHAGKDPIRANLLWSLRSLNKTRLMVTSRFIPTIEIEFEESSRLEIRAHDEDIQKYIEGRIPKERRLLRHVKADQKLRGDLARKIIHSSQGM